VARVLKETFQAAARAAQQQHRSTAVVQVLHSAAEQADHAAQLLRLSEQVRALQQELAEEKAARQQEQQELYAWSRYAV
jgi:hypothetical protein